MAGAPRLRSRPGLFSRKAALRGADGRSIEARVIAATIRVLGDQLGGEDRLSAGQRIAIHSASLLAFRIRAAAERYVTTEDVEGLDRHVCTVQQALMRTLIALGCLEPPKVAELSLADYLEAKRAA
jgi:hypothetical protein